MPSVTVLSVLDLKPEKSLDSEQEDPAPVEGEEDTSVFMRDFFPLITSLDFGSLRAVGADDLARDLL